MFFVSLHVVSGFLLMTFVSIFFHQG
uniref:Uncharacterized protein n=1 Tax=Arundo donax TaxID=35708 RepID=A0A0A9HIR7_ARUDO